jgi:hypothetical protein
MILYQFMCNYEIKNDEKLIQLFKQQPSYFLCENIVEEYSH